MLFKDLHFHQIDLLPYNNFKAPWTPWAELERKKKKTDSVVLVNWYEQLTNESHSKRTPRSQTAQHYFLCQHIVSVSGNSVT